MKIEDYRGGKALLVVIRREAEERLAQKRFRGTASALAGNFSKWGSLEELMVDPDIREGFLSDFWRRVEDQEKGTFAFEFDYDEYVGWENTDNQAKYQQSDLEWFAPNGRSRALRVRKESTHLLAPLTKLVTVVYELKNEEEGPVVVIHSLYPGKDIGDLNNNITAREKRIFFDWDHPGRPLR